MTQRFLSALFVLAILLSVSGCQTKIKQVSVSEPKAPAPIKQAQASPNLDESAIIVLLAQKNQQEPSKYQLHDVEISANYEKGRWSYEGHLTNEFFWAVKETTGWRLVCAGKENPNCADLADWPLKIKAGCRDNLNNKQISNFYQCQMAGGKIENLKPRRCFDEQDNVFVEIGAEVVDKRYISQDLNKCADLDFDCALTEKRFMDGVGCGCQKKIIN